MTYIDDSTPRPGGVLRDFDQVDTDDLFTIAESLRLAEKHWTGKRAALLKSAGGRNWRSNELSQDYTNERLRSVDRLRHRVALALGQRYRA